MLYSSFQKNATFSAKSEFFGDHTTNPFFLTGNITLHSEHLHSKVFLVLNKLLHLVYLTYFIITLPLIIQ